MTITSWVTANVSFSSSRIQPHDRRSTSIIEKFLKDHDKQIFKTSAESEMSFRRKHVNGGTGGVSEWWLWVRWLLVRSDNHHTIGGVSEW